MYTKIKSAASLVRRLPQYPLKKPDMIIREPPNNSAKGTIVASHGAKPNQFIMFCDGKGSFDNHGEKRLFLRKLVKSNHLEISLSQRTL